jgi:phage terminase Nu1 subunit (DNA packaging protein)
MMTRSSTTEPKKEESGLLVGWQQIANFLGQPLSVAQRWAKSGMPISREGRRAQASPEELNGWLGRESNDEPVQIATESPDLSSELKRGFSFVRKHRRS